MKEVLTSVASRNESKSFVAHQSLDRAIHSRHALSSVVVDRSHSEITTATTLVTPRSLLLTDCNLIRGTRTRHGTKVGPVGAHPSATVGRRRYSNAGMPHFDRSGPTLSL